MKSTSLNFNLAIVATLFVGITNVGCQACDNLQHPKLNPPTAKPEEPKPEPVKVTQLPKPEEPKPEPVKPANPETYTVKRGDTLTKVAHMFPGVSTAGLWYQNRSFLQVNYNFVCKDSGGDAQSPSTEPTTGNSTPGYNPINIEPGGSNQVGRAHKPEPDASGEELDKGGGTYCQGAANTLQVGWVLKLPPTEHNVDIDKRVAAMKEPTVTVVVNEGSDKEGRRKGELFAYLAALADAHKVITLVSYSSEQITKFAVGNVSQQSVTSDDESGNGTDQALALALDDTPATIVAITDRPERINRKGIEGKLPTMFVDCLAEEAKCQKTWSPLVKESQGELAIK